jgi:hypothetical protein
MPRLPDVGWLKYCVECDQVTSRITRVRHYEKKTSTYCTSMVSKEYFTEKEAHACIKCRDAFINRLLGEFERIFIVKETVGEQIVHVYGYK